MADSPYLPQPTKDYIRKFDLQALINSTVNQILINKPDDPYGFMIGILQKSASSDVQILGLKALEHICGEGFPTLKILASVSYLNKPIEFFVGEPFGILDDQSVEYDADRCGGKGISKSVALFNETLAPKFKELKCSDQVDIDKQLEGFVAQNGNTSLYAVNTLSFLLPRIVAHVTSQPLFKVISAISQQPENKNVQYIVNCLEGGKAIGSKCKAFKYTLISKPGKHDPFLSQAVLAAIRKAIVSGKGGEAALKFSPDKTFVCPLDTINDNLKIVEDAIAAANAKQFYTIGVSWNADSLFSQDTKKYELENPKTPFDNDQMIDFLVKLVTDKPIISYLEDPLASTEKAAWKKLTTKLKENEATKNVCLGSRGDKLLNVLGSGEALKNSLSELSINVTSDSHPDLSEQDIAAKNADKFCLQYLQCRAFELKTLTNIVNTQKILSKSNTRLILQDNFNETYDTSLVDICLGSGAVLNISSINQGKYDRVAKLTRVNEIFESC